MIQQFNIYKNDKKTSDNHPDYRMVAKENNVASEIGAIWLKKGNEGKTYMSCSLSESRSYNGKDYDGYVLIKESEYDNLKKLVVQDVPEVTGPEIEYPADDINPDDIPF